MLFSVLFTPCGPALLILGAVLTAAFLRDGSYLCRASYDAMFFRRPLGQRLVLALTGLAFWESLPLAVVQAAHANTPAFTTLGGVRLFSAALMLSSVGGVLLHLSGPADLHLDLAGRCYRRVGGWLLLPRTQAGGWDDIQGVYLREVCMAATPRFLVGVILSSSNSESERIDLGRFREEAPARQLAAELTFILGLPQSAPVSG